MVTRGGGGALPSFCASAAAVLRALLRRLRLLRELLDMVPVYGYGYVQVVLCLFATVHAGLPLAPWVGWVPRLTLLCATQMRITCALRRYDWSLSTPESRSLLTSPPTCHLNLVCGYVDSTHNKVGGVFRISRAFQSERERDCSIVHRPCRCDRAASCGA